MYFLHITPVGESVGDEELGEKGNLGVCGL